MTATGWLPNSEPAPLPSQGGPLPPPSASLHGYCPEILAQAPYQTCTSMALLMAMSINKIKRGDPPFGYLSRLQLYYDQREIAGNAASDAGACIAHGIEALKTRGVAREQLWPYSSSVTTKPPQSVYDEAASLKLITANQVGNSINDVKRAISAGYPVVAGLFLRQSFMQAGANGGMVPMPNAAIPTWRNHVVCLVGYGAYPGTFTFANSWGPAWGDDGFGYLPEAVIGNPALSASYWAIINQD